MIYTCLLQSVSHVIHVSQADEAEESLKRVMANKFDFNDFLTQMKMMNNMGGTKLLKLLPGMAKVGRWRVGLCGALSGKSELAVDSLNLSGKSVGPSEFVSIPRLAVDTVFQ